jgi:hypothetical protein
MESSVTDATKRCPFCAEEILEAALKCKHCGEHLGGGTESRGVSKLTRHMSPTTHSLQWGVPRTSIAAAVSYAGTSATVLTWMALRASGHTHEWCKGLEFQAQRQLGCLPENATFVPSALPLLLLGIVASLGLGVCYAVALPSATKWLRLPLAVMTWIMIATGVLGLILSTWSSLRGLSLPDVPKNEWARRSLAGWASGYGQLISPLTLFAFAALSSGVASFVATAVASLTGTTSPSTDGTTMTRARRLALGVVGLILIVASGGAVALAELEHRRFTEHVIATIDHAYGCAGTPNLEDAASVSYELNSCPGLQARHEKLGGARSRELAAEARSDSISNLLHVPKQDASEPLSDNLVSVLIEGDQAVCAMKAGCRRFPTSLVTVTATSPLMITHIRCTTILTEIYRTVGDLQCPDE